MKDKKTFKVKLKKAEKGYQVPMYMDTLDPQYLPVDNGMQNYQPETIDYIPQETAGFQPQQAQGNNFGRGAMQMGKAAGQALNSFMTGAPQLINAILPAQDRYREPRQIPRALTRNPQGNNSQALYKRGGTIDNVFTDLSDEEAMYYYQNNIPLPKRTSQVPEYQTSTRRKGGMQVTEEIPTLPYEDTPVSPYGNFAPQQVALPRVQEPRNISYSRQMDIQGRPTAYLPEAQGYSHNEWLQTLPQLPEYIDNIPVVRSPELYKDFFTNFQPNTQSSQWQPTGMFEDGGELPSREVQSLPNLEMNSLPADRQRTSSYNNLAFGEAFKKARKELGAGNIFEWKGKKYTTNIAKEESVKPIAEVRATKVAAASPKTQKVSSLHEFIYNTQKDSRATNNPVTSSMQQFNPAFNSSMDLNLPQEETVYGHNRPAPKGLQKLAQNPEFNTWAENVFEPAMLIEGLVTGANFLTSAGKKFLKTASKSAANANKSAYIQSGMQNVKASEAELGQYNLQRAKQSSPYPIDQWKKTPSRFEGQGQSPASQYANQPTYTPYGSPVEQVNQLENMTQSPIQQMFPFERSGASPVNQMMDVEHAWSPLQRSGLLPKGFKNGGKMYNEGEELDLSPAEIKALIAQGYQIDILK